MLACLLPSQAFAAIDAEQDTFAKGLELVAYTPTESDSSTGCMYCDNQEMFWVPGGGYWAILLPQTGEKAIGHFFTADPNAERREISTLKGNGSGMLAADLNNNGRVNMWTHNMPMSWQKGCSPTTKKTWPSGSQPM